MTPPSSLDRYAVLGHPVAHSCSPFIHEQFACQTGQALEYGRLLCPLDGFAEAAREFARSGAHGANVTVPFKLSARRLAEHASERAVLAGAANTLSFREDGWFADNTDGVGLVRDIEQNAGLPLARQQVLLVGAGGAGAGVLGPLIAALPARVMVANRSQGKALALVQRHRAWADQHGVRLAACSLEDPGHDYGVVLNASASSLQGQGSPVSAGVLAPGALVLDLMYGPEAEPFLAWARAANAHARDGLGMLVEQAAESFFIWRGVRPLTAPVLQALRLKLQVGE